MGLVQDQVSNTGPCGWLQEFLNHKSKSQGQEKIRHNANHPYIMHIGPYNIHVTYVIAKRIVPLLIHTKEMVAL